MAQVQLPDNVKAFLEVRLRALLNSHAIARIRVVEGKGLLAADAFNSSDPYVILKLGSQTFKSEIIYKTLNPEWHQETIFAIEDGANAVLKLQVWDKDVVTKDDFLGEAQINLQYLPFLERNRKWVKLSHKDYPNKDCGAILLEITTTPPDFTRGISPEFRQTIEGAVRILMFSAYMRGKRATHGSGISAKGTFKVLSDPRLAGHAFFRPGNTFTCTLRHSNTKGFEDDRFIDSHGCAIKIFDPAGDVIGDFVTSSGLHFGASDAGTFVEYLASQADPNKARELMDRRPSIRSLFVTSIRDADSYTNLTYVSFVTYQTVINGKKFFLRFRVIPHHRRDDRQYWVDPAKLGQYDDFIKPAPDDTRDPFFLRHDFAQRIANGGVKYFLQVQLRDAPDVDDPNHPDLNALVEWPEDVPHIDAAEIEVNSIVPFEDANYINVNPFNTVPGMSIPLATRPDQFASLLHLRWFAYIASALGRKAKEPLLPPAAQNKVRYTISIKTGSFKKAGTNEQVKIRLENAVGNITQEIELDNKLKNDFQRDHVDVFRVEALDIGDPETIYIYHDLNGKRKEEWLVEWASVEHPVTHNKVFFSINQWCPPDGIVAVVNEGVLPQNDIKRHGARRREIEGKREIYQFTSDIIPSFPPIAKELPFREEYDEAALGDLNDYMRKAGINRVGQAFIALFSRMNELDDFYNIYPFFKRPEVALRWRRDEEFGQQRLNGPNPLALSRVIQLPPNFPVTNAMIQQFLRAGETLDSEIAAGRMYIADYKILEGIIPKQGFYLAVPLALFYVGADSKLRPIAIQLKQIPHPVDNPIFTPADEEYLWLLVKMHVACADKHIHQTGVHLMATHFVMEPIIVAAHRTMSNAHPLLRFLTPHFKYNLAINHSGLKYLISPGGWIDKAMSGGSKGAIEIGVRYYSSWKLEEKSLPRMLRDRGVDNPELLPNYYYRDDGLLVWNAIRNYVNEFVHYVYPSTDSLFYDWELQNWVAEMVSEKGAKVKGIFGGPEIRTHDQLISILTEIIWTVSAEHGCVNMSQYDYSGFVPNSPGTLRTPFPKKDTRVTEADIVAALPTVTETLNQVTVVFVLSRPSMSTLGVYDTELFVDPAIKAIIQRWQQSLKEISTEIKRRNEHREVPYPYLNPEAVPNSIAL